MKRHLPLSPSRAISIALAIVATSVIALTAFASPMRSSAGPTTIIVTTTDDVSAISCTLRDAIDASNTDASFGACIADETSELITFDLGIVGTPTITIDTALPDITDKVTIQGDTGGADRVELAARGVNDNGLTIKASNVVIQKLVINNFGRAGIQIATGLNHTLYGNFIGTDSTGANAVPNRLAGVEVLTTANSIGGVNGTSPGGSCTGECNLISGNAGPGIELKSGAAMQVIGNFIGTNVDGDSALSNQEGGILSASVFMAIGDTSDVARNVISGNVGNGVKLNLVSNVGGAAVTGNFIGTNSAGTGALGNSGAGVYTTAPLDIGNTVSGGGNVISGNAGIGIDLQLGANGSTVKHNFIGTNAAGTAAIANAGGGVHVGTPDVVIGGTTALARNVISGNPIYGLNLAGSSAVVQGNYIGTNAAGTSGLGNLIAGIQIDGSGNTVGGTADGAENLISGNNPWVGIQIQGGGATGNIIQGNLIGTKADGVTALGNGNGIHVCCLATNNTIGGTGLGEGNTIAFNIADGVYITNAQLPAPSGIAIRTNSIHSNGGKGINIQSGGNDGIAPPVITAQTPVTGTACASCIVDVFSDSAGQGRIYHGSVTAIGTSWTFVGAVSGPNITATATNANNSTSEFSAPFPYTGPTPTPSPTPSPTPTPTPVGQTPTPTPTPTPVGQTPSPTPTPTPVGQTPSPTPTATPVGQTPSPTPTATPVPSPTTPPEGWHQGDANCSGDIDLGDVTTLLKIVIGLIVAGVCPTYQNDVNCDTLKNALDALGDLLHLADAGVLPTPTGCTPIGDAIPA